MENRFGKLEELGNRLDARINEVSGRIDETNRRIDRLTEGFTAYQEFFIELLTSEGILKAERALLARGELIRIIKLVGPNPLSREEVKRLEELLMKDELTLEEALELREIARKVVREYGKYPEAWKLHAYASVMVGLALRREAEKREGSQR
ncbi:hypothetical protein [Vulcanisaeta thermophila]|uniref:hypothetical protein n=1 Tax=Vulcanisaeta thermophila TaxID=867917 RepID=UPI001EE38371|nr:hypothetical protein [Vulcanisaeta thermophila]